MADEPDEPERQGNDGGHFDDAELEAMLENFEEEFHEGEGGSGASDPSDAEGDRPSFEDELEGLLGDKAKAAFICTRLNSAELLAAFCQISDISAECIGSEQGAVAVLHNLDGDGPEAAVKDLTKVVVNRADKVEATVYYNGQAGEQLPPPFVFPSLAPFVEDVMLGISTVQDVLAQSDDVVSSDAMGQTRAYGIIAKHTHMGNGQSSIE